MLAEARREAPPDAEMEEIIALAADKAEEAHEEARDDAEQTDVDTGEVLERLAETTDDLRETSELTGSLKPMWPLEPMPRICTSTPPASSIASS